jgi:hypothetical protein
MPAVIMGAGCMYPVGLLHVTMIVIMYGNRPFYWLSKKYFAYNTTESTETDIFRLKILRFMTGVLQIFHIKNENFALDA